MANHFVDQFGRMRDGSLHPNSKQARAARRSAKEWAKRRNSFITWTKPQLIAWLAARNARPPYARRYSKDDLLALVIREREREHEGKTLCQVFEDEAKDATKKAS